MPNKSRHADNGPRLFADDIPFLDMVREMAAAPVEPTLEGALDLTDRLKRAVTTAIAASPLSRWQIAGEMSHLLGRKITRFMIDAWTAESKEAHHIPADVLPALCRATGNREPLRVLAEAAGLFALPGPEALRAEIRHLEEEARRANDEKRKRVMFLREMEGEKR